jgi:ribose transport system substrate-binding protein
MQFKFQQIYKSRSKQTAALDDLVMNSVSISQSASLHVSRRLFCSTVLMTVFCGCGGGDNAANRVEPSDVPTASTVTTFARKVKTGKVRIALVMKSLANEFFSTMAEGASIHAHENPEKYELIVNGIPDETDLSAQVSLVEQMIAQNVDAIVIAPADSQALIPVLKRAHDAGIVVVNIDNKLDAAAISDAKFAVPFVGPDNRVGAKDVGAYLASKLTAGDAVAILEGVQSSFNGQQRKLGFEDSMQAAGLGIVDSQSAQWEMSVANQTTAGILTAHPEIKAILACNDSMALGAMAATKAADRKEVLVVGFDNISAVQQAIRDGQILATADQHGDKLAVFGIELALKLLKDANAIPLDKETPVDLVTAETLLRQ